MPNIKIWNYNQGLQFNFSKKLFDIQFNTFQDNIQLFINTKPWQTFKIKGFPKIQSRSKYLKTFLGFIIIFLYHKWRGTRLLSTECEFISCLSNCWITSGGNVKALIFCWLPSVLVKIATDRVEINMTNCS